ncbi:MAG: putative bifunctional diguanylate cyclase/phosphodiesterase [Microbacteriaceae bacterium]
MSGLRGLWGVGHSTGAPKPGQVLLALVLLVIVFGIIFGSFFAAQQQESQRQTVLSEEGDGTAMTFVQRESFGVILAIDEWARGGSTAREAQIARALLSQRLTVVTASGLTTFELVPDDYVASLAELDSVVRALPTIADEDRSDFRIEVDSTVAEFATQSRILSEEFQRIIRDQAQLALTTVILAQLLQGAFLLIALVIGISLGWWILADISRNYRESSRNLADQTSRLELARSRLVFRQQLDKVASDWSDAVTSYADRSQVVETIFRDLTQIAPDWPVLVATVDGHVIVRFEGEHHSVSAIDHDDIRAANDRAEEVLQLLWARDSIEREFEDKLKTDPLTGLPNRGQFDRLVTAFLDSAPETVHIAVVIVDVDRFADFNSSFGRVEGDQLLVEVVRRIGKHCRMEHMTVRLSADEFAVFGPFENALAVEKFVESLSDELHFERLVGDEAVPITAAIGFSYADFGKADFSELLQRAGAALGVAQYKGNRQDFVAFDAELHDLAMSALRDESVLRAALKAGEFCVHFQPIVDLATGDMAAVEALVRWQRPQIGVIFPDDFLPAIRRAGLLTELGRQVIDKTLMSWGHERRVAVSEGRTLDGIYVSINIDAEHLANPTMVRYLVAAADRYGVPTSDIVVEVTEHVLLDEAEATSQLRALRENSIRVALDDFGTGYSSLSRAQSLPLDILKIDKSFIEQAGGDIQGEGLVRDIISIAKTLGLSVTAEGVETRAMAATLSGLGVQCAQGWFFGKAVPPEELRDWISSRAGSPTISLEDSPST